MLPIAGALLEGSAVAVGFIAGAIAVGGFIGRAQAMLRCQREKRVEYATIVGGLHGLLIALLVIGFDQRGHG